MSLTRLNRKVHYWISLALFLPLPVIALTGGLLQLKKQLAWVQPTEQRGGDGVPVVSFADLLAAARANDPTVRDWQDVPRIEVRPQKGLAKVVTAGSIEVQVDLASGAVLQAAVRRSDWIESLHDGSWFGDWVKFAFFLPAAVVLLFSTVSGVVLFVWPFVLKARKRRIQHRLEPAA